MILSAYEIIQTIIRINLLIVSVVSTCIVVLKKTIKNNGSSEYIVELLS